jgi:hypothetical protein
MTKTDEMMRFLLTSALEGGSNYWYMITGAQFPEGITREDFREGGRFTDPNDYWHPTQIIPFHPGCGLLITDDEEDMPVKLLDKAALEAGLEIMKRDFPRHYNDAMEENDDADTGDVFLQCCVFGKLVFG